MPTVKRFITVGMAGLDTDNLLGVAFMVEFASIESGAPPTEPAK
ncbi:MAG: hypothetical protein Q8R93_18190 [Methylicorpusculum sp.]|nr:hypothetical protein [Methylicorpusculum sp.]